MNKKASTTKLKGILTDGSKKTCVLVETIDNNTGEVIEKIGVSMPRGADEFDKSTGERVAFDKACLSNLTKLCDTHYHLREKYKKLAEEESRIMLELSLKIGDVLGDLARFD